MKQFTKISLILCGIFIIIGLSLVGIGMAGGVTVREFLDLARNGEFGITYQGIYSGDDVEHTFTESIEELKVSVDQGTVEIVGSDSDEVKIAVRNAGKDFRYAVEDGILDIEETRKMGHSNFKLTIYLPEEQMDKIKIDLGAGEVSADKLWAREIDLDVGAGSFTVESAEAEERAELSVGTGELEIEAFKGGDIDMDCGVGEITLTMSDAGQSDYNYYVSCGIGEIQIGSNSYSGLGSEQKVDNNAEHTIDADCGIGSIEVNFSR